MSIKDINDLKEVLEKRLGGKDKSISFDKEQSVLRVEYLPLKKGVDLDLNKLLAKYENKQEKAIDEIVYYITTSFEAMNKRITLKGKESYIYPVIRSTSFPIETKDGHPLLNEEHTAETRIYYALDMGEAYTMLDKGTLEREGMSFEEIKETAQFNLRALSYNIKEDQVAGNRFYFINSNDGYDASKILNEALLEKLERDAEGDLALAVPHQDVLIVADIQNEQGYDVLGQMAFKFFGEGRVPITALPFLYEKGRLEPIFILARKKPKE